ncbi:bifunctional 3'-5' exonuclease/ATP-dependent helicase WRN-like [Bolinopsis microptera]|uniref:bifunctional 3'-5' exonuclease/ATP-dependent helicase WRN-like n=1 Tax=Bolinopsis microptera TaxID=2820187 RepID=UPI003079C584
MDNNYSCQQKITVIIDTQTCDQVIAESILAQQVLGMDCEWNDKSKIALIQVATVDDVFLFRITKFADKQIPTTLRDILENPDIIKVGVGIENDAKKLRDDYKCNLKSWVDLRNLAVNTNAYAKVILKKLKEFEETLASEENENKKKAERYGWNTKWGLAGLTKDCLGIQLRKGKVKWKYDWEADTLMERQISYAAADGAACLDIFYTLMSEKELGTFSADKFVLDPENCIKSQLTDLRLIERKTLKDRSLKNSCFKLITEEEFDLTDYKTQPPRGQNKKMKT